MYKITSLLVILLLKIFKVSGDDVLGCGGFVKSHVPIDFSKVEVKLLTKQGILKDKTNCAPNNGYYFLPLYDKGEYLLEISPPPGWSFTPNKVELFIDGASDLCSQGKDINFAFQGFGITGRVESWGDNLSGPEGVTVELKSAKDTRLTTTSKTGSFFFTPVFPGTYTVSVSNSKWKVFKQSIEVKVTEANTELSSGSLIIYGYHVSGYVKSDQEPIADTAILLFTHQTNFNDIKNFDIEGCIKDKIAKNHSKQNTLLCYVKTNKLGQFKFGSVPNGKYYVQPFYENLNIEFKPAQMEFTVENQDVEFPTNFEIVGFTVSGKAFSSSKKLKSVSISNIKILIDGKHVTDTNSDGVYKLDKLKTGSYRVQAIADNLKFEETVIRVNPNTQQLPDLVPSFYKICGKVISDTVQQISITGVDSDFNKMISTDVKSGQFCEFLPSGSYEVTVSIRENSKVKGFQFFPMSHKFNVDSINLNIITFSQLKASLTGKVQCLRAKDCENLKVLLRPVVESSNEKSDLVSSLTGNEYVFKDLYPGAYEVFLVLNKFCWKSNKFEVNVNSLSVIVPTFIQNGYSLNFVSSHNTKVEFKINQGSKIEEGLLEIMKGQSVQCVPKAGVYSFEPISCHIYSANKFKYDTDLDKHDIRLEAEKHLHKLCIAAKSDYGQVRAIISLDGEKTQTQALPYSNGCYWMEMSLGPGSVPVIVPQSEVFYFEPPVNSFTSKDDCVDLGELFKGIKGHVFKGKIVPPLAEVVITLESDNGEIMTAETDTLGFYRFPPKDETRTYQITAKKDSYVLVGPKEDGGFVAHKLAEVVVEVLDEFDKSPLQGALLSLSGSVSYRSNLQTNEHGRIVFNSLSPSEYYLRPMMKEYSFEPNSKIINVEEGQTINVTLVGKRVAYSAYGQVSSLNGGPESNIVVEAAGVGNCSHFSEDTITESNGKFRVRGLQPFCSYHLRVRSSTGDDIEVERSVPELITIQNVTEDSTKMDLVIFRKVVKTKVLAKIYSENAEYYKTLRVKVIQKGTSSIVIHNIKLDSSNGKVSQDYNKGILVYIPPLVMDGKLYNLQLETSSNQNLRWKAQTASFTANSSFKYLELNFVVKGSVSQHHIKETSLWTIVFIVSLLVLAYNIEIVLSFLSNQFNLNFNSVSSLFKKKTSPSVDVVMNDADIDQLVQKINAVNRKPKSRKT